MLDLRIFRIAIITALLSLSLSVCYAIDDDFGSAKKIESEHFTIYYAPELDVDSLTQQLNIRPSDEIITGKSTDRKNSSAAQLADMLDTLFRRVCDILDMQLYSFQGNIKICKDQAQLERVYKRLFDSSLHHQRSFYVYSLNTIYSTADSFSREILGHEIGHAVISRYFVVLPSVRIQEILAGYVEYQLRNQ